MNTRDRLQAIQAFKQGLLDARAGRANTNPFRSPKPYFGGPWQAYENGYFTGGKS